MRSSVETIHVLNRSQDRSKFRKTCIGHSRRIAPLQQIHAPATAFTT
uniref:Uncharacterized protein n=1 Tax=Oryza sativa subsp. japonica TaxID=39947 RepID=Q2R4X6_ORYSJ|nr:hypothetical protein LOC_Os11g26962 [Oryza sativa Japonica Group]